MAWYVLTFLLKEGYSLNVVSKFGYLLFFTDFRKLRLILLPQLPWPISPTSARVFQQPSCWAGLHLCTRMMRTTCLWAR